MTAGRPKKEPKWPVRLDGEVRSWVRELMEMHPETWASERAALHELLRIGRLAFTGPSAAAPVPARQDNDISAPTRSAPAKVACKDAAHGGEPVLDTERLARELRLFLEGEPWARTRSVALEVVTDLARKQGFELTEADAARVLERALGGA